LTKIGKPLVGRLYFDSIESHGVIGILEVNIGLAERLPAINAVNGAQETSLSELI
jgi:hypothetical protein